ncbi:MAG: ABC transporter substrate-binding protein, partial [Ilumatobacteraceae bacterium]
LGVTPHLFDGEVEYMKKHSKATRLAASLFAVALIASACGGDDEAATDDTTALEEEPAAEPVSYPTLAECADVTYDYTYTPPASAGMTVTYDLNPDAVWEDGSPITAADFKATWEAALNTPGSISTVGYDQITSVEAGSSDKQVVVEFKSVYGPYKGLFGGLLKAASVKNTSDISADFADFIGFSGRPWVMKSWSPSQVVYVPNKNYWGDDKAASEELVIVPMADDDTQVASIKAGEVDFVYPQFYGGIEAAYDDPNITLQKEFGGDYEGFYFQQKCGPFANPIFRAAFSKSIDRDALFQQIYVPLGGESPLQCGPIVPGPYCNGDEFANAYDPAGAEALLTENGWTKGADGYWLDPATGEAPDIRWIINTGNTRRENTQAYLIPLLNAAGFKVRADNCDAACYFQQRLPALDYDMAMYISTAPPDPGYLTPSFTCDQIPTAANNNQGQNSQGWCNAEASDLLHNADFEADATKRAELVKSALKLMAADSVMLPLFQFPKAGFWRTDQVGGPVGAELRNYTSFINNHLWTDLNGDGKVVLGAEQWPACLNPVTECANSSWMVWTTINQVMPGAFATTNDGAYVITNLLTGEPTVNIK